MARNFEVYRGSSAIVDIATGSVAGCGTTGKPEHRANGGELVLRRGFRMLK